VAALVVLLGLPTIGLANDSGQIPNAWGLPASQRIGNSECPSVEGRYDAESGERVRTVERGAPDDTGPAGWRMLFRHPRISDKSAVSTEVMFETAVDRHYLEILQPSPDKFQVSRTFIDGKGLVTYYFDQQLGDFDCRDGFIVIKPMVTDQTGYFSKSTSRFTRTQDGALAYYERIENQRREMILFSSSALVHYWYLSDLAAPTSAGSGLNLVSH
jgi:hypothetical protein